MAEQNKIIYTYTDEAPMLATYSFLPIIQCFAKAADVEVELQDISLAGRIISQFPEYLEESQKIPDYLSELGALAKTPAANIIKLPNISASIPQLMAAIKELNEQGYKVPPYPAEPKDAAEKKIQDTYKKVLGSAVNPVLREGNSDRRVATAVKKQAQKNPHKLRPWTKETKTYVASMDEGDFFGSEVSTTMEAEDTLSIEFIGEGTASGGGGTCGLSCATPNKKRGATVLKDGIKVESGEIVDCSCMNVTKLREYFAEQMKAAKEKDLLLSAHLKATMMKVSDPIIFGHMVETYFKDVFEKHALVFKELGVNPNLGVQNLYDKIKNLDTDKQKEIEADIQAVYKVNPALAMVDSDKGITNLHSPNDIIIDASMPVVVRDGGKMWTPENTTKECICCIPDRSYAGVYQAMFDFVKENGQFDVSTMGNVCNVGLMAQKAQEYGSHDCTFEMESDGEVIVKQANGTVLLKQRVFQGDIFRLCRVKDAPIKDWVRLAVTRAKLTGSAAIFWLNEKRGHDAELLKKVNKYLPEHDTKGLDITIATPEEACVKSMQRAVKGEDTISVTGNVLRDYLTDLFPILELGTSAKMLSIVPLLQGGGLYETGAGGSAPKHIQQLIDEGHLRWDSLGEFLALQVSIEELGVKSNNKKATLLAKALDDATCMFLDNNKNPGRGKGNLPTHGSHFWLCLYWAQSLAAQEEDADLKAKFGELANELEAQTKEIETAFMEAHASAPFDIGGYYHPDPKKAEAAMRPVTMFNDIITKYTK